MNEHAEVESGVAEARSTISPANPAARWRSRSHRLLWPALAVLLLAAAVALWVMRSRSSVAYITAAVDQGPVTKTVSATGTVNPVLTVTACG
jgi:HlyD family secretion protein